MGMESEDHKYILAELEKAGVEFEDYSEGYTTCYNIWNCLSGDVRNWKLVELVRIKGFESHSEWVWMRKS